MCRVLTSVREAEQHPQAFHRVLLLQFAVGRLGFGGMTDENGGEGEWSAASLKSSTGAPSESWPGKPNALHIRIPELQTLNSTNSRLQVPRIRLLEFRV